MSVNQSVYGNSADWVKIGSMSETDRDKLFLMANFGDDTSTLHDGVVKGKLEYDEPIDKSLSWCGLGNESTYSRVEYWNKVFNEYTDPSTGKVIKFEKYKSENRLITNFAWIYNSDISPNLGVVKYSRTDGKIADRGGFNRWSPEPAFFNNQANGNCNSNLKPITQIPVQNCVLVPVLRVRDDLTTTTAGKTVYLWDYLNTNNAVNYTNNPYITSIGVRVYTYLDSNQTTRANYLSSTSNPSGITVLDELNYQEGEPIFYDVPGVKMGLIYSYSANYFGSKAIDRVIFGTVTQGAGSNISSDSVQLVNATQSGNGGIENRAQIIPVLPHPDAQWTDPITSNLNTRIYYITYYDGLKEWIRHQIACFGLFFTDDQATAESGALDSDNMLLGTLVDGVGHGDYTSGEANRSQPQWDWKTTNDSTYDPKNPPRIDPNQYDDTSGFNNLLNAPRGFNARYVLTPTDIRDLNTDFFQALNSKPDDIDYINYSMSEFLTNDPLNAIVSLKWFPFTVPSYGAETPIKLGNYNTTVTAKQYVGSGVEVYNIGEFDLFPFFGGSFLDYEPYSKTSLVIPYCGTVQLDHSIYMDTHVSVFLNVDIYTGACTAYIKSNGLVVDSVSGVCSVDMPITGIDNATLEGQIYNASLNLKSSKISEGTTIAGAGLDVGTSALGLSKKGVSRKIMSGLATAEALIGAVESVNQSTKNLAQNEYNVSHVQIPMKTVGAQSGLSNAKQEQFCRVLLQRPIFINGSQSLATWYGSGDSSVYAHTVGYACLKMGKLSDFTGFTVCSNADLSGITATDAEKEQILRLLQSGVYV